MSAYRHTKFQNSLRLEFLDFWNFCISEIPDFFNPTDCVNTESQKF